MYPRDFSTSRPVCACLLGVTSVILLVLANPDIRQMLELSWLLSAFLKTLHVETNPVWSGRLPKQALIISWVDVGAVYDINSHEIDAPTFEGISEVNSHQTDALLLLSVLLR